ncbi:Hypothetical protein BN2458_PEG0072 [Helicobacter typhlonius]|uniref:Uncharacterized protein n=1 Tax=Helicobacter typhlonius TaxID=76936 RepID=A0A0S4PRL9_9HELI|nr:Hypothetical protein BN2458_PEG0072 [Helicobacter typhlonius]
MRVQWVERITLGLVDSLKPHLHVYFTAAGCIISFLSVLQ